MQGKYSFRFKIELIVNTFYNVYSLLNPIISLMNFALLLSVNLFKRSKATSIAVTGDQDVVILSSVTMGSLMTFAPNSSSCFYLSPPIRLYVVAFLFFSIPLFPKGRAPTQIVEIILFNAGGFVVLPVRLLARLWRVAGHNG